jgi:hypothetical protein
MDPATIGLLISIAPTVLELLFGGSVIKHEMLLENTKENPKEMYGYGLEGYGYRYPRIEEYYEEPIKLGTVTKGRRKGKDILRYPPKVDKKWVAAYLLNKQTAEENKWRKYAKEALQKASEEYFNKEILPLKEKNPDAYARALQNKLRRMKREKLPLALRTPEGQKLYEELKQYEKDKAKLREIYYGKQKKERKRKALKPEEIQEIIEEYQRLLQLEEQQPIVAKK